MPYPPAPSQSFWGMPQSFGRGVQDIFPQYGGNDDPEFRKQLRSMSGEQEPQPLDLDNIGPRELQLAGMTGDPVGTIELAKKIRADKESHALLKELALLDPTSKDYPTEITKLLGKYTYGSQVPGVDRALNLKTLTARHATETKYDDEVASLAKKFALLDENDPDFDTKSASILGEASEGAYKHPRFDSMVERVKHYAAQAKGRKTAEQQEFLTLKKEAGKHGINTDGKSYSDLQDEYHDTINRGLKRKEFTDAIKLLPREDKDKYLEAITSADEPPTDEEKMAAVGVVDKNKMSDKLWSQGYNKVIQQKIINARKAARGLQFLTGVDPFQSYDESIKPKTEKSSNDLILNSPTPVDPSSATLSTSGGSKIVEAQQSIAKNKELNKEIELKQAEFSKKESELANKLLSTYQTRDKKSNITTVASDIDKLLSPENFAFYPTDKDGNVLFEDVRDDSDKIVKQSLRKDVLSSFLDRNGVTPTDENISILSKISDKRIRSQQGLPDEEIVRKKEQGLRNQLGL